MAIEAATACNRVIPFKNLKITHNYVIFLFYSHFLVNFLVVSRSTELIFDYIEISGVRDGVLRGKCWPLRQIRPVCVCVFCPPFSVPCTNYEVTGFQPQAVDTPDLGYVHTPSAFSIPPTLTMHASGDIK